MGEEYEEDTDIIKHKRDLISKNYSVAHLPPA